MEKKENIFKKFTRASCFPLIILYIIMLIIFTVWSKLVGTNFFKASTFKNILESIVITSFLAIGSGCLLIGGNLDLSQASVGAFAGAVIASMIYYWKIAWPIAAISALILCAVFGAINALLITKFRFPAFIATLAMSSVAKGFMYLFSAIGGGKGVATNVNFKCDALYELSKGKIGNTGITWSVLIMAALLIIYGIIMAKSGFGAKCMIFGGNPVAASMAGINATAVMYILCINCSCLGGLAGIWNAAKLQQGALTALATSQFTGLTACILGGISFGGGKGNMFGAFLGILILNTFQIGMSCVGLSPYFVNICSGALLIIALAFDIISTKRNANVVA